MFSEINCNTDKEAFRSCFTISYNIYTYDKYKCLSHYCDNLINT